MDAELDVFETDIPMSNLSAPTLENGWAKGFKPRNYSVHPQGSLSYAAPFSLPTIPRSEWADRIKAMAESKTRLSDLWERDGLGVLNQGNVGYCHAFSCAMGVMLMRSAMGLPYEELSASSVAGPITGFRNEGAYIFDDLKRSVKYGFATTKTYPMLTTDNHWTPEAEADAAQHKVTEWWDGENRNFDQVMTCLLSRIPVCVGLNWWGHAVTYVDPVMVNGRFGVDGLNSWSTDWSYGGARPGWFRFPEGYGKNLATPDEWYAPRQITGA